MPHGGTRSTAQGCHFRRRHLFAVGGHVAAAGCAVADLIDELVGSEPLADVREVGAALAADTFKRVAVSALFVLEHDSALQLQRSKSVVVALDDVDRNRIAAPSGHHGRPGGRVSQMREYAERCVDENDQ